MLIKGMETLALKINMKLCFSYDKGETAFVTVSNYLIICFSLFFSQYTSCQAHSCLQGSIPAIASALDLHVLGPSYLSHLGSNSMSSEKQFFTT